jgi:membrane-associated phospholipid phosphatase
MPRRPPSAIAFRNPSMSRRILHVHLLLGAMLAALGLLAFDRPVAEFVRTTGIEDAWLFAQGTAWLDLATGKEISKFLLGGALLLAGAGLSLTERTRAPGRTLLYVANVQLFATLLTGVAKNLFGRLRPYEVLASGQWDATWFVGGSAFPSGHAGFYFGLCLPLAWRFPRWRWPLLGVAWFIAIARIVANDHYLGDVAASIAIAAALAWAMVGIAGKFEARDSGPGPVAP